MPWRNFQGLQVPLQAATNRKRRYSVTADILAFQLCSIQYGTFKIRKYEPALAVQLFYGTIIHQVLDRAHAHYQGLIGPQQQGLFPTDQDIENYFQEVENSLRARRIRAISQVRDQALEVLKRFNRLEGPTLYPRVINTECRLQTDQGLYILHGNVDVLATAIGQPNEIELWDYKGGKYPSRGDPLFQRYIFQMQVYAELYRRQTGRFPQRAILYFLNELAGSHVPQTRPVNAVLEVPLDSFSVNAAMASFTSTVQRIEQCRSSNTWPGPTVAPPEETCDACDLRWNCNAASNFGRVYSLIHP
ncbi:MAG: PD-(D/E)XK nuclease family protein [Peptococcaceae bacterium]|nr:PD-(D/E)XK nuclease family protein [Peptococcaceae bacterium]